MTSNNIRQQVFRRMLAREAGTGANAPAIAAAARRVYECFAEQLTPLIGDAGVAAICARSLDLTERNVRGLVSVRASAPGDPPFALLQRSLEQQEPAAATEAAVAVLATACELLALFIGEGLTTSLLGQAWPDDFAGDTTEETITQEIESRSDACRSTPCARRMSARLAFTCGLIISWPALPSIAG